MNSPNTPLRLERLEHENPNPDPYSKIPSIFYKATANQNLWSETGTRFNYKAVLLERVLGSTGISFDYDFRRELTEPTDIWLIRSMRAEHEGLLEVGEINQLLDNDTKPSVRVSQLSEYPSLLIAYRPVPIGQYALGAVAGLPEIDSVSRVAVGHGAGMYASYPQGTLTTALVNPAFPMDQAEESVRGVLSI